MLQLGEVEVYGTPHIDRKAADSSIELFLGNGGDENSAALKAVKDALENELTTQKELDILISAMYDEAGVTEGASIDEPEDEQTAALYDFEYLITEESDTGTETETESEDEPTVTEAESETGAEKGNGKTLKTGLIVGAAVAAAALIAGGLIYFIKKRKKQ